MSSRLPVRRRGTTLGIGLLMLVALLACAPDATSPADSTADGAASADEGTGAGTAPSAGVPELWSDVVDPTAIPLGDNMLSGEPAVGFLNPCTSQFGGRGAPHAGPWIDYANGTWDATSKVQVEGARTWPQATYSETVDGTERRITASNVPVEQVTGTFPIAGSDPAHQYDPNPNGIAEQVVDLSLPTQPTPSAEPGCVPLGPIGILKNGVYLYNAVDAAGGDAAAHETQDVCDGHPDGAEFYHFHNVPSCLLDNAGVNAQGAPMKQESTWVGYALDGYGIYVERDSQGNLPTNADLDACHGRTSSVVFNGELQEIYHYSATREFPYTIGCFHGIPVDRPSHER